MKKVWGVAGILLALLAVGAWMLVRAWDRKDAEAAARFEAALDAYRQAGGMAGMEEVVAHRPVPADDALPLYEKAFHFIRTAKEREAPAEGFTPLADDPDVDRLDGEFETGDDEARKIARALVARHAPALQALRKAAGRPDCAYPIRYAEGWEALLKHIADLLFGAKLLALEARLLGEEGKLDEAWEAIDAIFGAGMSVVHDRLLVSQLLRIVIVDIGLQRLEGLLPLGAPSVERASAWSARFDSVPVGRALVESYRTDLCCVVGTMRAFFAGRPTGTDLDEDLSSFKVQLARPQMVEACARNVDRFTRCLQVLNAPFDQRDSALALENAAAVAETLGFAFLIPNLPKPFRLQAALDIRTRMAFRAVAIRRAMAGGVAPEKADVGKDPVFGVPLIYRRIENGFVIEPGPEIEDRAAGWGLDRELRWELVVPPK